MITINKENEMQNLVAGVSLVSFLYAKDGINVGRVGRVDVIREKFIVVFVGGGKFKTFMKNKISDLTIIGG